MSFLSPAFLLAATFLCAASSTPMPAIAHDNTHDEGGLQSFQAIQQRHMTSSLLTNLASGSAMPFAASNLSDFKQLKLGRNLLNNLEGQQQQQKASNAKGNKDNNDKDSFVAVRSLSSVVQNWSLVCKQLCGASLGGEPCAAECAINPDRATNATRSQNAQHRIVVGNGKDVHAIFEQRRAAICMDLCEVGLGGKTCNCSTGESVAPQELKAKNFNIVCSSFCGHAGTTLKGCSVCKEKSLFDNTIEIVSKVDGLKYGRAVTSELAATVETTTPDWYALCESLCKTGDGGALCNCDLSPFFK